MYIKIKNKIFKIICGALFSLFIGASTILIILLGCNKSINVQENTLSNQNLYKEYNKRRLLEQYFKKYIKETEETSDWETELSICDF